MAHLRFRSLLISCIFVVMLALPGMIRLSGWVDDIPGKENRALASFPALDVDSLTAFPTAFDAFFQDHFPLRYRAIRCYSDFKFHFLGVSPIPDKAFVGKDGWFFFAGKEQWSFLGTSTLTPEELTAIQSALNAQKEWLRSRGTAFYVGVVPAKNKIYSEYMPTTEYPLWDSSWGQQLLAHLDRHGTVNTIDLYLTLLSHRKDELLYYKEDNHWTSAGAFYAANAILERIRTDFPAVGTNDRADFHPQRSAFRTGNITDMFGLTDLAQDSVTELVPIHGFRAHDLEAPQYVSRAGIPYTRNFVHVRETADTTRPRMVLMTDSFGEAILPFLAEHFSRSLRLFDGWEYDLNPKIIQAEQPDIVILLPTEANIRHLVQ